MYNKILVAYDRSEAADRALEAAIELVEHDVAKRILVMTVYSPTSDDPGFDVAARMSGNMNEESVAEETPLQFLREALAPKLEGKADFVDTFVLRGKPHEVIVEAAKDNGCDLIVMGRRGLTGISAALGSVSKSVLRDSTLPVLLVK